MLNASHGIDLLTAGVEEYTPIKEADDLAHLRELGLYIQIREVQAMSAVSRSVFISEIETSTGKGLKGVTVTAVGMGDDMPSAVKEAVAQWVLGVLPVLAHWRGKHSCFATSQPLETRGGQFELLAGPTVARGYSEDQSQPGVGHSILECVIPLLKSARQAMRTHWLELYANKFNDGSVDATCRINNHDWLSAKNALISFASEWPISSEPMQSSRRFAMLLPKNGDTRSLVQPSAWDRIVARA